MLANHRVNTEDMRVHEDALDSGVKDEFWEPLRLGRCQALYWVLTVLKAVDEVPVMLNVCVYSLSWHLRLCVGSDGISSSCCFCLRGERMWNVSLSSKQAGNEPDNYSSTFT